MNKSFRRELINPTEIFNQYDLKTDHITINPDLSRINGGQYDIIRESTHDGTLIFTTELLNRTIERVVNKESCFTEDWPDERVIDIHYVIGLIRLSTVYGQVDLPAGKYPGEKQRARMPVKAILIRA